MRNLIPLLLAAAFTFLSCNQQKTSEETTALSEKPVVDSTKLFVVDSVKVIDSLRLDSHLVVNFESKVLIFPSLKDSLLLDSIYAPENIKLKQYSKNSLKEALNKKAKTYFEENKASLKSFTPTAAQSWNDHSEMDVKSHEDGFLTIMYSGDGYTGGAHGYYYENYKVFDLQQKKTMQLSDLISDRDSKLWNRILMDNFLKDDLEKGQAEMLLVKEIPLNNNFYFDKKNLYFLYNQYEITAYAAGPVLIRVPYSAIKPLLKAEFKNRIGLQ